MSPLLVALLLALLPATAQAAIGPPKLVKTEQLDPRLQELTFTTPALAQNRDVMPLMVLVDNMAGVPINVQDKARRASSKIFREIDVDIIWDIVQNKLPELKAQVHRILTEAEADPTS